MPPLVARHVPRWAHPKLNPVSSQATGTCRVPEPLIVPAHHASHRRSRSSKIQKTAIAALEDIKARNITVLDVRKLTSLYDTLIIATAESNRQVKALSQHVREALKAAGASIIGVEGEQTGEWVLVDAGDIVVHIMQPATRAYYNLEELWTPPAPRQRSKAVELA